MKDLATRLAARIDARDKMAPDTPYELGRVVAVAAAADPEIVKIAKAQAKKIDEANAAVDQADQDKQAEADAATA